MSDKFLYQNHVGFPIIGAVFFDILVKAEKEAFLSDTNFKRPNGSNCDLQASGDFHRLLNR